MNNMHNPPHPGELLREDVLPGLALSVTDAARELKVARVTLSRLLNERSAMSADMALRIAQWLGHSPQSWLNMQASYDLWQASQKDRPTIARARFTEPLANRGTDV